MAMQNFPSVENVEFNDFMIHAKNGDKFRFELVGNKNARYISEFGQYVIMFNVYNGELIGYLEDIFDESDYSCLVRFTSYRYDSKKRAHYIRKNLNTLFPKKIDMNLVEYTGEIATLHYLVNSQKSLTKFEGWQKINEPLVKAVIT